MTDTEEGFQKLNYPIAQFFMETNQIVLGGGSNGSAFKTTINSPAPAANRVLTFPILSGDDSIAYLAQAQTLSNKTLTSPILNRITSSSPYFPIFFPDASYGTRSYFTVEQKAFASPYDSVITFAAVTPGNNNINSTRAYLYMGAADDVTGSSVAFIGGGTETNFGFLEYFLNANTSSRGKVVIYNSSQAEDEVMNFDSSIINFLKPISTNNIKPDSRTLNIRFPDAVYGTRSYFNIQQKAFASPYDSIITFAVGAYGNNNIGSNQSSLYVGTLDDVPGTSVRILLGGTETNFGNFECYLNADNSSRGRLAVFNSSQLEVDVMAFDSTVINLLKPTSIRSSGGFDATISSLATASRAISIPDASGTLLTQETANATYGRLAAVNTWSAAQRSPFVALTDASTIALDLSAGNNFKVILGGNRTLGIPSNAAEGQMGVINVVQDSTGGRTLTYGAGSSQGYWPYQFQNGLAFALSPGKFSFDQVSYTVNYYKTSTVTLTIATPCVISWTAHGLDSGQRITLSTTGALPTGLIAGNAYWVTKIDANTFRLSSSSENLDSGTFINTTGSQSGVHTAVACSITLNINPNNK
jgi:hypothetical protein